MDSIRIKTVTPRRYTTEELFGPQAWSAKKLPEPRRYTTEELFTPPGQEIPSDFNVETPDKETRKRMAAVEASANPPAFGLPGWYKKWADVTDLPVPEAPAPIQEQEKVQLVARPRTKLGEGEEKKFQLWYKNWAKVAGIDPSPDNPLHKYDYRGAYKVGLNPVLSPEDGLYHWDSRFKDDDHPNRFVGGIDTKTGQPIGREPLEIGKRPGLGYIGGALTSEELGFLGPIVKPTSKAAWQQEQGQALPPPGTLPPPLGPDETPRPTLPEMTKGVLKGTAEAGLTTASAMVGFPAGLAASVGKVFVDAWGPGGKDISFVSALKLGEDVMGKITYQPQTEAGQEIVRNLAWPFEQYTKLVDSTAKSIAPDDLETQAMIKIAANGAALWAGAKIGKLTKLAGRKVSGKIFSKTLATMYDKLVESGLDQAQARYIVDSYKRSFMPDTIYTAWKQNKAAREAVVTIREGHRLGMGTDWSASETGPRIPTPEEGVPLPTEEAVAAAKRSAEPPPPGPRELPVGTDFYSGNYGRTSTALPNEPLNELTMATPPADQGYIYSGTRRKINAKGNIVEQGFPVTKPVGSRLIFRGLPDGSISMESEHNLVSRMQVPGGRIETRLGEPFYSPEGALSPEEVEAIKIRNAEEKDKLKKDKIVDMERRSKEAKKRAELYPFMPADSPDIYFDIMAATHGKGIAPDYTAKTEKDFVPVEPRRSYGKNYRKAVGDERWIEDDYWLIPKILRKYDSPFTMGKATEALSQFGEGTWDVETGGEAGVDSLGRKGFFGHDGEVLRSYLYDVERGLAGGSREKEKGPGLYGENPHLDYGGENAALEAEAAAKDARARESAKEEKDVYSEEELEAIGTDAQEFGEDIAEGPAADPLVIEAARNAGSLEEFKSKFDKHGKLFCL
jgi:hypothetical protein